MKYKIKTDDGVTLHWLVCDNCGISTQKYDNEDELCRNAAKAGWFVHRLTLNIFCSNNCMQEYSYERKEAPMIDEELKRGDEIFIRAKYIGHARNCVICDIGAYNPLVYVESKNVVMSLREEKAEIKRLLQSMKGGNDA